MTRTAKTYGGALYDLACEVSRTEQLLQEMTVLSDVFGNEPEYLYLLATPSLSKEERCGILDNSFRGKIDEYLLNFLKILCENGTIREFPACTREYRRRYNADNGIVAVCAVTAIPLNETLQKKLRDRLTDVTGKRIELSCRVDPACLGGMRLEMDGEQMDGTVRSRLDTMRETLAELVL